MIDLIFNPLRIVKIGVWIVVFLMLNALMYSVLTQVKPEGFVALFTLSIGSLFKGRGFFMFNAWLSLLVVAMGVATIYLIGIGRQWRYIGYHLAIALLILTIGGLSTVWIYVRLFLDNDTFVINLSGLYFLLHPNGQDELNVILALAIGFGVPLFLYVSFIIHKVMGVGMTHGHSRFANGWDMYRAGLFSNHGIILGSSPYGQLRYGLFAPIIVISGVQGGKTKALAMPNLLSNHNESFIASDTKGELFNKTATYRKAHGSRVLKFEPASSKTLKYNPFALIRKQHLNEDLDMIFTTLIPDSKDPIWSNEGRNIGKMVTLFIMLVEQSVPTFESIYDFLCDPMLLKKLGGKASNITNKQLRNLVGSFLQQNEKFRADAMVNTKAFLSQYSDPKLALATSKNEIDMQSLRKRPTTLYLVVPANTESYNNICSLLFEQAIRLNAEEDEPDPSQMTINLLIDEFGNMPKIPSVEKGTSWLRSYRVRIVAFVQRSSQLEKIYEREGKDSFLASPVKIAFKLDSLNDQEYVSKLTGQTTIRTKSYNSSGQSTNVSHQKQSRALMTADDVARLPYKNILIFMTGFHPIKAKKQFAKAINKAK